MRIAAGIVAILMGTGNLMVVALYGGMIGSAAVWFGSLGPGNPSLSDWGSVVQFLSWMAPLLTIAGGIITFSHPRIGGVILGVAASAVWYLLGFGFLGKIFVGPLGVAAVLALLSPPPGQRIGSGRREGSVSIGVFTSEPGKEVASLRAHGDLWPEVAEESGPGSMPSSVLSAPKMVSSQIISEPVEYGSSSSSIDTARLSTGPVPGGREYDRNKWLALTKYDPDIAQAVKQLEPLGQEWVDECAFSYLSLNDKAYLPRIVDKICADFAAAQEAKARVEEAQETAEAARLAEEESRREEEETRAAVATESHDDGVPAPIAEGAQRPEGDLSQIAPEPEVLANAQRTGPSFTLLFVGVTILAGAVLAAVMWKQHFKAERAVASLKGGGTPAPIQRQPPQPAPQRPANVSVGGALSRSGSASFPLTSPILGASTAPLTKPKSPPDKMPVNSPTLDVGDTYLYEALDPQHPASKVTTRRTIISSHNGEIQFSSLNIGHKHSKPRSLYFTNDWNLVRIRNAAGNSGLDYSPPLKYYDFPLYPGKTWQQTTTETNITTGKTRIHTISGVVGPWEDVSVPAGRFRAIKVILRTELFDPATGERVNGADTSWYVPEVHRSVRTLETGKDGKERLIELTYYHLMSGQARFASSRIIQPTSGFVNADAFGRYAVSVYRGPSATPDFYSLPGSRRFRTRIRDGIRQGVNFAGHYAIVTFGCGTDCSSSFLVDVKSGQIFTFPLGGEGNYNLSLDYHADSALIKASWIAGNDPLDNPICVHQELVLRGTAFTSLRQTETKGKCER